MTEWKVFEDLSFRKSTLLRAPSLDADSKDHQEVMEKAARLRKPLNHPADSDVNYTSDTLAL